MMAGRYPDWVNNYLQPVGNGEGLGGYLHKGILGATGINPEAGAKQAESPSFGGMAHNTMANLIKMPGELYDSGSRLLSPPDSVKGFQEQGELYRPYDGKAQVLDAFNVASALPVGGAIAGAATRGGLAPDVPLAGVSPKKFERGNPNNDFVANGQKVYHGTNIDGIQTLGPNSYVALDRAAAESFANLKTKDSPRGKHVHTGSGKPHLYEATLNGRYFNFGDTAQSQHAGRVSSGEPASAFEVFDPSVSLTNWKQLYSNGGDAKTASMITAQQHQTQRDQMANPKRRDPILDALELGDPTGPYQGGDMTQDATPRSPDMPAVPSMMDVLWEGVGKPVSTFAANAMDPLGIPSAAAGMVAPGVRDAWRDYQKQDDGSRGVSQLTGSLAGGAAGLTAATRMMPTIAGKMAAAGGASAASDVIDEGAGVKGAINSGTAFKGAIGAAGAGPARVAIPATVAAVTGGNVVQEAQAREKSRNEAVINDPTVGKLKAELERADAELQAVNAKHKNSGKITHGTALKPIEDRREKIKTDLKLAENEAGTRWQNGASYRENNPGMAEALFGGALAVAGGVAATKGVAKKLGDVAAGRGMAKSVEKLEQSFGKGKEGVADIAAQQARLESKVKSWDRSHSVPETVNETLGNMGKGAILGAEASSLPEQIDYISNDPGHPARDAAEKAFKDPNYYTSRIAPGLLGASAGMAGGMLPKMIPYKPGSLNDARELVARGGKQSYGDIMKSALGQEDAAVQRVSRLNGYFDGAQPTALSTPQAGQTFGRPETRDAATLRAQHVARVQEEQRSLAESQSAAAASQSAAAASQRRAQLTHRPTNEQTGNLDQPGGPAVTAADDGAYQTGQGLGFPRSPVEPSNQPPFYPPVSARENNPTGPENGQDVASRFMDRLFNEGIPIRGQQQQLPPPIDYAPRFDALGSRIDEMGGRFSAMDTNTQSILKMMDDLKNTQAAAQQGAQQGAAGANRLQQPRNPGEGPWAARWSNPARQAIDDRIASGLDLAGGRGGLTQKGFSDDIAGRMPDGVAGPSQSEATNRLKVLRSDIGEKPTLDQYREYLARIPNSRFSAAPFIAGGGAMAGAGDPILQALFPNEQPQDFQSLQQMLSSGVY